MLNDVPWLFSRAARSSPEHFRERSLPRLGELAHVLSDALSDLPGVCSAWAQHPLAPAWGAAFSRECLLAAGSDSSSARSALEIARKEGIDLIPFPGSPSVEAFFDHPPTSVLIPLERNQFAQFGQIWIFAKAAWPTFESETFFQDLRQELLPDNLDICLVGRERELQAINGCSWELGATLAVRAHAQRQFALPLAKEWIITGGVTADGQTEVVGFSAKKQLARTGQGRKWLLPAANQSAVEPEWEATAHGQVYFAHDLESCWSQITGAGFIDEGTLEWTSPPLARPSEFHCYVSPALGPILAAILWSQPKKVVIWASKRMETQGTDLKKALSLLRATKLPDLTSDDMITIVPEVDDSDLQKIRANLLSYDALGGGGPAPVIFSITGGNLLMRVALLDLARLRPHLHLVYRQESREGLTFVHLSHPNLRPVAGRIQHSTLDDETASAWKNELLDLDSRTLPDGEVAEGLAAIVSGLPWPSKLAGWLVESEVPDHFGEKQFSETTGVPVLKEKAL